MQAVEGVSYVETDIISHIATVTFDESRTSVEKMTEALAKKQYYVQGEPKFLK